MIAAADSGCDSDGRQRSAIEAADSGPDSGVRQRSDSGGGQRSVIVAADSGRDSNGRDCGPQKQHDTSGKIFKHIIKFISILYTNCYAK